MSITAAGTGAIYWLPFKFTLRTTHSDPPRPGYKYLNFMLRFHVRVPEESIIVKVNRINGALLDYGGASAAASLLALYPDLTT